MRGILIGSAALLLAIVARADEDNGPDTGPMAASNGGRCSGGDYHTPSGGPSQTPLPICKTCDPTLQPCSPCRCDEYHGRYPDGVFYSGGRNGRDGLFGDVSASPNAYPGCNKTTMAADPNCSFSAEASGYVGRFEPGSADGDGDSNIDLCPDRQATIAGDRKELRDEVNFTGAVVGALHVEVQDCRFFGGTYSVKLPPNNIFQMPAGTPKEFKARPSVGDMISVYGNWIGDIGHHGAGRDDPHAEIHEAHAIAVTRPLSPTVSYSFVNVNFVKEWDSDTIEFDVEVPPSGVSSMSRLTCTFDATAVQSPSCPPIGKTSATAFPQASLPHYCHLVVRRDPAVAPLTYGCHQASGCTDAQGKPLTWLHLGGGACPQIFFSGALRAEWVNPSPKGSCAVARDAGGGLLSMLMVAGAIVATLARRRLGLTRQR
jgi:hypothetical protein